jgi:hypothetical protein
LVPSRSIEVTSNSPAQRRHARAKPTASMPVGLRPPWVKISHLPGAVSLGIDGDDDALIAEFRAASATKSGSFTAAVLIETLSAPASSSLRMSSACGRRHRRSAA